MSTGFGPLSALLFAPLLGAILLMCMPAMFDRAIKWVALGFSIAVFAFSIVIYRDFNGSTYHFQYLEQMPWIPMLGIQYKIGIDGLSIWLILLTTFLTVISIWFSFYVRERVKTYMIMMLILETAMLGVFCSLDLILFYTFFEASLIPMYFLISIWGGANKKYASVKFFIYTFAGSLFMLIGMITLFYLHKNATGVGSFDLLSIQEQVANGKLWAGALQTQGLVALGFAVALAVKCPMFPFHTWLPDAHVEAPTAGSVILAGVLLKMGTYGFLRLVLPIFPDIVQQYAWIMMILAVVGILYGAIVSTMQPDWKKLVAYSSVAHMGFVMLGIFSLNHTGMMGGAYQQLNHGISTGALFLLIGLVYERTHTRLFKDYGGLKAQMPVYSAIFLIVMLSSVGLPATNGFIGEFLAMLGAFHTSFAGLYGLNVFYAVLAGIGVILAAVYLLYMFQQVFYGEIKNPELKRLKDLKPWEIAMCGTLVLFVFWGGLYPNTFLKPMEASIGAARMMAIQPPGKRPVWSNLGMEMDHRGNLVEVAPRIQTDLARKPQILGIIAPADFDPQMKPAAEAGDEEHVSLLPRGRR